MRKGIVTIIKYDLIHTENYQTSEDEMRVNGLSA